MADNLKESSVFRIQKTDVTGPDELITPVEDLKESQKTTNLLVTKTTEIIKNEQPSSISKKDDLDTDEDRLDRMQMEDHGVSWVDTPDKIPVCMQIVNASMWKPFLPQTRSPAHNR
ncbi:Uncharacterized protein BM_BM14729 [Brugia malayi]|uniref:Bm14729 n=1 Tax=Brugia malayi TaxID=6279 RepID=A0A0J9XRV3_BRUMA|nr:Uncharacterized protein BM_BM14729 [Brugia malayi]CDP93659.1 Bm14729 [Brugia malayi]VIO99226.1 Uncharacterized protein BM_BM14729 [Brugia malayi]